MSTIPETPPSYVVLGEGTIASDYALKNLNAALGKAQTKFSPAVKDLENKYGGYKYVPLENIISSSRPSLADNHITVMQFPASDLDRKTVAVVTRISHWDSGEWVQNTLEVPAELALGKDGALKFNQQTIGGGVTYARKIAYKPILGVADSDDDIDAGQEQPSMEARPSGRKEYAPKGTAQVSKPVVSDDRTESWVQVLKNCPDYREFKDNVLPIWAKSVDAVKEFLMVSNGDVLDELFRILSDLDSFNEVVIPLNKVAYQVRRPFIQEVHAEATKRGYVSGRTGLYEVRKAS